MDSISDDSEFFKKIYISTRLCKEIQRNEDLLLKISNKAMNMSNEKMSSLVGAFSQFNLMLEDLLKEVEQWEKN